MRGGTFEHVGDSLNPAVWMIGEAADRSLNGIIKGEVVEEQEGIELVTDPGRDRPAQLNACAFDGVLWLNDVGDFSEIVHEIHDDTSLGEITGLIYNLRDSNRKRISIGTCGSVCLGKLALPQIRVREPLRQGFYGLFAAMQSYNDSPAMAQPVP